MAQVTDITTASINIGQIFYMTRGYEDTSVYFFQVVGKTAKSLKLRELDTNKTWNKNEDGSEDRTSGGYVTPINNTFISESKTARFDAEYLTVRLDGKLARLWEGQPQRFTSYG